jgi:8-oxo-dGTP diphosphatase
MYRKPIDVVCAIIWMRDKILVAQRSEKMSLPLKWEFPGGKVDVGESEEECLHRELMEELNISVKVCERLSPSLYDYGTFVIRLIPFIVEYNAGKIRLAEHREVKTFSKEDLKRLDWAPADLPILNDFLKYSG